MQLEGLKELIAASTSDDWNVIVCWGADSGPSYLDRHSVWKAGVNAASEAVRWGLDVESHGIRAAYKPNVSVGLAYGLEVDPDRDGLRDPWRPDWARHFADSSVTASWVDILWCGMLVDRRIVLRVDGDRALLPSPRGLYVSAGDIMVSQQFGNEVTEWDVSLARIVHGFEHLAEAFDDYLDRAEFVVTPDSGPSGTPPPHPSRG